MIEQMKQWVRLPSAKQLLQRDLESAERMRLSHQKAAEEHAAWVDMLNKRIARINRELINTKEIA